VPPDAPADERRERFGVSHQRTFADTPIGHSHYSVQYYYIIIRPAVRVLQSTPRQGAGTAAMLRIALRAAGEI